MNGQQEQAKPLDRYLSPIDVWAMAFGIMVGWGVFAMPGNTFLPVARPAGTLIAMVIGMTIMLIIGSNISYLMGHPSITGGVYSYTKEAFGRDHAFLSSWFLCLSYLTIVFLNGTAMFYIVRMLLGNALETGIHYRIAGNEIYPAEALVSALVLGGVGLLCITAKPFLQRLHTILALLLFAGVAAIAAMCLPRALSNGAMTAFGSNGTGKGYAVFSLVILAPWAFVGFEVTSFDTAHFKFSSRKSWPLIILSIVIAAFAYISMALSSVAAIPEGFATWQEYISSSQPGYYDAVLMDIQMPVMDGYTATRSIRALENKALADVPILAMTANAFQEDVNAAMDAGMQAHIAKPIDISVLTKTLLSVLKP